MSDCAVCCFPFNKTDRKEVKCPFCGYSACRECVARYLFGLLNDPHCMNIDCRHEWSMDFMDTSFTKKFISGDYRKRREFILLEREKQLLPDAQQLIERELHEVELKEELKKINVDIRNLRARKKEIEGILRGTLKEEEVKRVFTRACPANDCRGFLDEEWKCGICGANVCKKCHEVIKEDEEEHECDEQILENVKELDKSSKPCPRCGSLIYKISGCAQMWCTQCHATFDWATGRLEAATVHNPHYYEYIRQQNGNIPRNPGDVVCGGIPDYWLVHRVMSSHKVLEDIKTSIGNIHRLIVHIADELAAARDRRDRQLVKDRRLTCRVKYIKKAFDEKEFGRRLCILENERRRHQEIRDILVTLVAVSEEAYRKIVSSTCENEVLLGYAELLTVMQYANACLEKHSIRFGCCSPRIQTIAEGDKYDYRLVSLKGILEQDKIEKKVKERKRRIYRGNLIIEANELDEDKTEEKKEQNGVRVISSLAMFLR